MATASFSKWLRSESCLFDSASPLRLCGSAVKISTAEALRPACAKASAGRRKGKNNLVFAFSTMPQG